MTLVRHDEWLDVHAGNALDVLRELPSESVHCVVTSPPYYGLRSYGTDPLVWGGDAEHEHTWGRQQRGKRKDILPAEETTSTARLGVGKEGRAEESVAGAATDGGRFCECGAWLGHYGLEPSLGLYVEHTVLIFRELRRVLRRDGTVWLNLGDSYNAYNGNRGTASQYAGDRKAKEPAFPTGNGLAELSLKPKDRMMVPARVALALQDDGWWLRDEIVWAKPNPMPSSVSDRTTPSHEMIYLLSRSARYFYDQEAIKEPLAESSLNRVAQATFDSQTGGAKDYGNGTNPNQSARKALENLAARVRGEPEPGLFDLDEVASTPRKPSGWRDFALHGNDHNLDGRYDHSARQMMAAAEGRDRTPSGWSDSDDRQRAGRYRHDEAMAAIDKNIASANRVWEDPEALARMAEGRNKRSVWSVPSEPYPEAHFATFPQKLVEPMIQAGTSEKGVCPECGAPWVRAVGRACPDCGALQGRAHECPGCGRVNDWKAERGLSDELLTTGGSTPGREVPRKLGDGSKYGSVAPQAQRDDGWRPTCDHVEDDGLDPSGEAWAPRLREPVPATVLDPFAGSGTTGLVAQRLSRRAILIDLNPEYIEQALKRTQQVPLGLEAGTEVAG